MGRFNTISTSAISVTAPNFVALNNAITDLASKENDFYNQSKDELNSYLGQSGKSKQAVEAAYDALLGDEPWTYLTQLSNSGNSFSSANGNASYYVQLPSGLVGDVSGVVTNPGGDEFILYSPGAGLRQVDLLYTNIALFGPGSSSTTDLDDEDDEGNATTISYSTGFAEIPVAYQSNSTFTGIVAQTLYTAGTRWNSIVGSAYSEYLSQLNSYNTYVGGSTQTDIITTGPPTKPWDGYTQSGSAGYNRPDQLSVKVVEEARGYN